VIAVFLTWFATKHPYSSAAIALVLVVIIVILTRWIIRAFRQTYRRVEDWLSGWR
jgi:hypothetical protein